MLSLTGCFIIVSVVGFLLSGKGLPIIALVLAPLVGALLAGFSMAEIGAFYTEGGAKVIPVATMFVFAIIFFGIMQDVGMFRPVVQTMIRLTQGNVVTVTIGTALLGMLAHLDGAGATTFLLTVPALLPLYRRMGMNPYLMLMLLALGAGITNMTPWAGPLGRASAATGLEVGALWRPLIAIQLIGAALLVGLAAVLGLRERHRIALSPASGLPASVAHMPKVPDDADMTCRTPYRSARFWLNGLTFAAVVATLIVGILPAAYVFMLGVSVALLVNYPSVSEQVECVKRHAPNAIMMAAIIMAAGAFLGILASSGMLQAMSHDLVRLLPNAVLPHLHLVLGGLGIPMELVLNTDAYYLGLLPVVQHIVAPYGVSASTTIYALMIGNIVGTFISPFSPALWLALGLAGLEMGRHIRYSIGWMWGFSIVLMMVAALMGIIPLS
ncbi:citrate transporter [Burkholderia ubonensis]|uniref:CitMHS family transporter n=1 Tax=Burkholderia ubonensis TaxID=101571 RepID=UPI00075E8B2E|nr:citrate:proton symporter [Burkholderia ubonensis]KVD59162.1 citrate transporter [Burkholderia ubonensis]